MKKTVIISFFLLFSIIARSQVEEIYIGMTGAELRNALNTSLTNLKDSVILHGSIIHLLTGISNLTDYESLKIPLATGNIDASVGITAGMFSKNILFTGTVAVDITKNPQIAPGFDGEEITIIGTSDSRTLTLDDGNGLQLLGTRFILGSGDVITLLYIQTMGLWVEKSRSNN